MNISSYTLDLIDFEQNLMSNLDWIFIEAIHYPFLLFHIYICSRIFIRDNEKNGQEATYYSLNNYNTAW